MANIRESVVFDICDAKVYEMLTDTVGASAGPSYGAAIDIPGVGALSGFDPQITSAELKGDCRVVARQGRLDSINASVTWGKVALDVLAAINDGTIWTSGLSTGLRLTGGAEVKYFKFEGHITGTDAGVDEVKLVLYKAQASSQTIVDQTTDNFGQPKMDMSGIGIDSGADAAVLPLLRPATMADIIITSAA